MSAAPLPHRAAPGRRLVITVVNTAGPTSMPVNEFVAYRARRFPDERHLILVWEASDAPAVVWLDPDGRRPEVIDCGRRVDVLARALADIGRAWPGGPALVHLHQPKSGLLFHLARVAARFDAPVLFTVHNTFDSYRPHNRLLSAANVLMARAVSFVSEASHRSYPRLVTRLARAPLHAIPNGVDLDRIERAACARATAPDGDQAAPVVRPVRLLNVGRMVPVKDQALLLDAVARSRVPAVLTVVGDGPLAAMLRARAAGLGIADRVRFTGLVPREQVYREMADADLFVSTSSCEGMPVAVLEAMALGLPVLLSDIPPHREIHAFAPDAVLVPRRVDDWAERLDEALAAPAAELARRGRSNRDAVRRGRSLERMHAAYTALYDSLLRPTAGGDSPG